MKKWGIRATGVLFLFWGLSALIELIIGLIKGTPSLIGFMGIKWVFTYGGESIPTIDVMAWIGIYFMLLTGYYLFRLHAEGRVLALIFLWISILRMAFAFVYMAIEIPKPLNSLGVAFNYFSHSYKLNSPGTFLITTGGVFLFYAVQIYFLMRKDVKMEFRNQRSSEVKPPSSEEPFSNN